MIVDQDRIFTQLRRYNPWWFGQGKPPPPFRRVAFGRCYSQLIRTDIQRAVLLSGPRRVGKSTILNQVAHKLIADGRDPKSVLYATLDDNILKLAGVREIINAYRERIWASSETAFLLLDEVHYAHEWDTEVKTLVDHSPQLRILATGSASLETGTAISHSGVGRWTSIPIPTLSFYEFLHLIGKAPEGIDATLRPSDCVTLDPADLLATAARLEPTLPDFRSYLLVGGFPETAKLREDIQEAQRLLREDVVDRVLKRDITALFGVRNVTALEKLFLYICLNSGSLLNVSRCATALGANRATVDNHLEVLTQANLLYRLPPFATSGKQVLKAQHKYYLVDAALRNAILLSGEEVLDDATEAGRIVETAVLRHLRAFYYRDTPQIAYWHGPDDLELDIVVSSPRYTIGAEVKYREQIRSSDLRGVQSFALHEKPDRLFMITRRQDDFGPLPVNDCDTPLLRIPAHIFTYLIGQAETCS